MIKTIKKFFPLTVTLIIFFIIFLRIDISKFVREITTLKIVPFLIALTFSLSSSIFVGSQRYRLIARSFGHSIGLGESIVLRVGSSAIVDLLPLKIGEIARILYLKRRHGLQTKDAFMVAFLGYFFDVVLLFIFMCFGLTIFINGKNFKVLLLIISVFILPMIFFYLLFRKVIWFKFEKYILMLKNALSGLRKNLFILFLYSLFYVGSELISFFLICRALSINIPFLPILFFIPLVIIISKIPISVFGLGTREAAVVLFFRNYAIPEKLVSSGILLSFLEYILPLLISLIFIKKFLKNLVE